jgi:hypothetical protein
MKQGGLMETSQELLVQHQIQLITEDDDQFLNITEIAAQMSFFEPNKRDVTVKASAKVHPRETSSLIQVRMPDGQSNNTRLERKVTILREPVFMVQKTGDNILYYPTKREQDVLDAIKHVAANRGFSKLSGVVGVVIQIHELVDLLRVDGKVRYSAKQVSEAISMMSRANLTVIIDEPIGRNPLRFEGNIIKEIITREDLYQDDDGEMINQGQIFVALHGIIMMDIERMAIRQADYGVLNAYSTPTGKALYTYLSMCYYYANESNHFDISVSDLRIRSNLVDQRTTRMNMRDANAPVLLALHESVDKGIIERFELIKSIRDNRLVNKRRSSRIIDEVYRVWPTKDFIRKQVRSNAIQRDNHEIFSQIAISNGYSSTDPNRVKIPAKHHLDKQQLKGIRQSIRKRNQEKTKDMFNSSSDDDVIEGETVSA